MQGVLADASILGVTAEHHLSQQQMLQHLLNSVPSTVVG